MKFYRKINKNLNIGIKVMRYLLKAKIRKFKKICLKLYKLQKKSLRSVIVMFHMKICMLSLAITQSNNYKNYHTNRIKSQKRGYLMNYLWNHRIYKIVHRKRTSNLIHSSNNNNIIQIIII